MPQGLPLLSYAKAFSLFIMECCMLVMPVWVHSLQIVMLAARNLSPMSTFIFITPKSTVVTAKHK